MLKKSLLAAAQLIALCFRNRQLDILLRDTVPKIFDKLKAFRAAQLKERFKFAIHAGVVYRYLRRHSITDILTQASFGSRVSGV